MTHPYIAEHLIAARERDIRSGSARARLAALARCCRPARITPALASLRERVVRPRQRYGVAGCCA